MKREPKSGFRFGIRLDFVVLGQAFGTVQMHMEYKRHSICILEAERFNYLQRTPFTQWIPCNLTDISYHSHRNRTPGLPSLQQAALSLMRCTPNTNTMWMKLIAITKMAQSIQIECAANSSVSSSHPGTTEESLVEGGRLGLRASSLCTQPRVAS